ncbi:hypothetical protein T11_2500 [Trichinella zimbabwensis]|uniref:MULE transposase domain-containing protein n=1 Tax=Trichinella zimbabwensis TaxID=268475 RepID=A0A0V1HQ37_9BILA|nr:hypothetical protein T11_2500 [Trichinella zimbabwensis]
MEDNTGLLSETIIWNCSITFKTFIAIHIIIFSKQLPVLYCFAENKDTYHQIFQTLLAKASQLEVAFRPNVFIFDFEIIQDSFLNFCVQGCFLVWSISD